MVERHTETPATPVRSLEPLIEPLREHEIHVWTMNLDTTHDMRLAADCEPRPPHSAGRTGQAVLAAFNPSPFETLLSDDEAERAGRFRFHLHRNRFVRCRRNVRMILSGYLHCDPREIRFGYGPNGKPSVNGLHFNVAHSNNLAVVAVGLADELGIDVEAIRWLDDFDELVARFFCPREAQLFARLPNDVKPAAFFNLWTRKEALLKATGEGIAYSLNQVDVTFLPDEPPCVLSMPQDGWRNWMLRQLVPAPGFTAALAVKDPYPQLKFQSYEFHSG